MNILVINPANIPFTNKSILAEPIDVLNIATIIKKEFDNVRVIDMDIENMNNDINDYLEEENIVVFVFDYQLPLHTTDAVKNIFETIKITEKKSKFIIIGKTSSYYYEKFIDNGIDIVIRGIADSIINDVIRNIDDYDKLGNIPNLVFKKDNKIIKTETKRFINTFKDAPIPDRSLVDVKKYMDTRTLVTSRGCSGTCHFCSTPFYFGSWEGKDASIVVDEIEMLINEYNAKKIIFLDDNALVDKQRMLDICNEIQRRNIKSLFGALCSIKCYDKELVEKMYEIGFRWIHFGLESGSREILKKMHKDMDINYVKQVIKEVKEIGYRVRTSFILDYPTSTKEDLIKTKDLILELLPHELRLHYLAYRVGTPIFNQNKDIQNKTQYIHSNKPNIENDEIVNEVNNLLDELKKNNYEIITEDIDWNKYNNLDKKTKIAAFTPIKYGMCWYE